MPKSLAFLLSLALLLSPVFAADESAAILAAAKSYVRTQGVTGGVRIEVEAVEGSFARARVVPTEGQTDAAYLFLKKAGGSWKGLTLGTGFSDDDYARLKIPRALRAP